mmetsp:Transcript_70084/g.109633  ORF Transcript_70084/g.109633 Transcript_70084/m.109633 type:complete len:569 (-) Transcript_70084:10-1716(-)
MLPADPQMLAIVIVVVAAVALLIALLLFFCDGRPEDDEDAPAVPLDPGKSPEVKPQEQKAENTIPQLESTPEVVATPPSAAEPKSAASSLRKRTGVATSSKVSGKSASALEAAATPARSQTAPKPACEALKPPTVLQRRASEWKDLWPLRKLALSRLLDQHCSEKIASSRLDALKRSILCYLDDHPKFVASGCDDGQARIYDLRTGKMLISVRHDVGARVPIRSIHLDRGPTLLTGTWDGRWHNWDVWPDKPSRPEEFNRGEKHVGHENQIVGLGLSRDQCKLVSANSAGKILIFRRHCPTIDVEVSDLEEIAKLKESLKVGDHSELYLLNDIQLGGKMLQWGDELLKEADFEGKQMRRDLDKLELPIKLRFRFAGCLTQGHPRSWRQLSHDDTVLCFALSAEPSGEYIYSGSRDRTVRKWNLDEACHVHTYTGHASMVRCLAVNCKYVASGSDDRTVRVWRKDSPELIRTITAHVDFVHLVALCPTFVERLVSASYDGRIILSDVSTGEELVEYRHPSAVSVAALQLQESMLLTCCSDKQLRVWGTETGRLERQLRHPGNVTALSLL